MLVEASAVDREVDRILRQAGRHEEASVRRQIRVLEEARRAVVRQTAATTAGSLRAFQLESVLGAIDTELARFRGEAVAGAGQDARTAFLRGQGSVDRLLSRLGITEPLAAVSPELLQGVIEITTDQVREVWGELGGTLKATVRRATLGITDPFESMREVSRAIREPKTFRTAETRAEAIMRTEVNRTFEAAGDARMRQANARLGGGLKKYWLTAGGGRVREAHASAGRRYAPGSDPGPIPVDQPFIVGGESLMFPLDPRASARNTIQCRCKSVLFVGE